MENELKPEKRRWLPRRIFRYGAFIMISTLLLVYLWFYLFQEAKLFEPHKKPTGYVPKPQLEPSADYFLTVGEAQINSRNSPPIPRHATASSSISTATEEASKSVVF